MHGNVEEQTAAIRHVPHDVRLWRELLLTQAGFSSELVSRLASDGDYDLHELMSLVDRGCRPDLAARILAPR